MNELNKVKETDLVACKTCLKEFPKADGHITEVDDYVINFCGLECYEKWQKKDSEKVQE